MDFLPLSVHARAMGATLILDDPQEAFTNRQREMLALLVERLPEVQSCGAAMKTAVWIPRCSSISGWQ